MQPNAKIHSVRLYRSDDTNLADKNCIDKQ